MKCTDCPYHWKDENDRFPRCHFESLGTWDPAPCEIDEPIYDGGDEE